MASAKSSSTSSLDTVGPRLEYSYVRNLRPDPDQEKYAPNNVAREVSSGHYVRVAPAALRAPFLIATSASMARALGLEPSDCAADAFVRTFSGDLSGGIAGFEPLGWATPYALSIYGTAQSPNGAGKRGYGYGDGRAISIGELAGMELQLKGGGPTPFCRGADGAAVLRSSVREFIASEAMHALGVPTTRALSLIASREEVIMRPWYSNASHGGIKHGGDVMVANKRAITTRVARSFLRVGQFELYGRRAARGEATGREELALLARHAMQREYPDVVAASKGSNASPALPPQAAILRMLRAASVRFAALPAEWLRVGYVQSNFNSDNCLVGGVTMDYGPFGFIEKYDPRWAMWVGAGDHFAFMNQPNAAYANFAQFLKSLLPLFDAAGVDEAKAILVGHQSVLDDAVNTMWARKLGFPRASSQTTALFDKVEGLLAAHPTDFTIAFRQLIRVLSPTGADDDDIGKLLGPAFYEDPSPGHVAAWREWVSEWRAALQTAAVSSPDAAERMRMANPRFVPREWLLVEAYTAAEKGDYAPLHTLHRVLQNPYDEQPEAPAHFYSRAPKDVDEKGGVGFMS
jgi:uncharacterized protein YdiU (UPF0061 family)